MRTIKTLDRRRGFINRLKTSFFYRNSNEIIFYCDRGSVPMNALMKAQDKSKKDSVLLSGAFISLFSVIIIVLIMASLLATSTPVAGDVGPKEVRGYIMDAIGNPLEGANVTVNVKVGAGPSFRATLWNDSTGSDGFYKVTFAPADWVTGDTIEVIATYDIYQQSNSTTADSSPIQQVDVSFLFVIPELGGLALPFAIFGVLVIFAVFSRRNSSE